MAPCLKLDAIQHAAFDQQLIEGVFDAAEAAFERHSRVADVRAHECHGLAVRCARAPDVAVEAHAARFAADANARDLDCVQS